MKKSLVFLCLLGVSIDVAQSKVPNKLHLQVKNKLRIHKESEKKAPKEEPTNMEALE